VATQQPETHHTVPRCLLRLHERAQGELRVAGLGAWLEFEMEAQRWGVPVEIDREDLEELVERSAVVLEREKHRLLHQSDWQRWGRRQRIRLTYAGIERVTDGTRTRDLRSHNPSGHVLIRPLA
jgi:hypothetical protein